MVSYGMNRLQEGSQGAWLGILANLALALMKGLVGVMAGSKAMLADALHSATDLTGSLVTLVAFRVANKPPDDCHPYGHVKAESLAEKIIGLILIITGINVAWMSVQGIVNWDTTTIPGATALYAALLSILVKEGMFQYKIRLGRKLQSVALMANAWEHRSDAYTSIATFIGIGGARLGYPVLDPIAGLVVALIVVRIGIKLVINAMAGLMDKVPDPNLRRQVADLAAKIDGVKQVGQVWLRPMGDFILAELTIGVSNALNVGEGHQVAAAVRDAILYNHEKIIRVFIHVNPL